MLHTVVTSTTCMLPIVVTSLTFILHTVVTLAKCMLQIVVASPKCMLHTVVTSAKCMLQIVVPSAKCMLQIVVASAVTRVVTKRQSSVWGRQRGQDGGSDGFGEKRGWISRIQWREDGSDDGKGILRCRIGFG